MKRDLRGSVGLAVCIAFAVACNDERNPPAPPGGTAGSLSFGGGGEDGTAATEAGTAATEAGTGSETSDGTTGTDSGGDATAGSDGTTGPGAACVSGEPCEGDGVCVTQVLSDGVQVVCSHGMPGEPCSGGPDCDSGMCVSMATGDGVVSICE